MTEQHKIGDRAEGYGPLGNWYLGTVSCLQASGGDSINKVEIRVEQTNGSQLYLGDFLWIIPIEVDRTAFEGGGIRDGSVKTERFELAWTGVQDYDSQMLVRYARWMARGAEKYDDRNWESFASPDALEHAKGSLLRHVFKLLAGLEDEDHAAAVWFNVQAIELIRGVINGGV